MSSPPFERHPWDRLFYTSFAVASCGILLLGFGPTYYFRFFDPEASIPPIVHLHALVFSAWMTLFLAQTLLAATARTNLHRTLGGLGVLLAIGVVGVGLLTAISGARTGYLGPGVERDLAYSRLFMIVPMRDLAAFAVTFALAIRYRNTPETHKRLMVLMVVGGLMPVTLARLPPPGSVVVGSLITFTPPAYDLVTRRRLHRVYWLGVPLHVLSSVVLEPLAGTSAWRSFADWLVG